MTLSYLCPEPWESISFKRLLHLGSAPVLGDLCKRSQVCVSSENARNEEAAWYLTPWESRQEIPTAAQPWESPVAACQPDTSTGKR